MEVGERILFCYQGGTHPGQQRIVTITEIKNNLVSGIDSLTGQPRNFVQHRMIHPVRLSGPEDCTYTWVQIKEKLLERINRMTAEELVNEFVEVADYYAERGDNHSVTVKHPPAPTQKKAVSLIITLDGYNYKLTKEIRDILFP
jgi:hypothetical protein